MNRHFYRVIFNRNLGKLVVVSEKTRSQGKANNQGNEPDNQSSVADANNSQNINQPVFGLFNEFNGVNKVNKLKTISVSHSHIGDQNSQTTLTTNKDLTIIGGQVKGDGITVKAKNLTAISVQDTATYDSKQQDLSAQATIGYGASVSGNYSKSNIKADYASVTEQTGFFCGRQWHTS